MADVEKKLGSTPDGLTQAEATKRLTQYGPNELEEKKTNLILKFLSYFWGPIPWMIEIAVILSAAARHWPDFWKRSKRVMRLQHLRRSWPSRRESGETGSG
jgi:H+-transporting ATPase